MSFKLSSSVKPMESPAMSPAHSAIVVLCQPSEPSARIYCRPRSMGVSVRPSRTAPYQSHDAKPCEEISTRIAISAASRRSAGRRFSCPAIQKPQASRLKKRDAPEVDQSDQHTHRVFDVAFEGLCKF